MSTRATYSFEKIGFGWVFTAYIHHDGYPSGAAAYLRNIPKCIEDFIRDNPRAEVTQSHEIHGDTEYRYYIVGDTVTCKRLNSGVLVERYGKLYFLIRLKILCMIIGQRLLMQL